MAKTPNQAGYDLAALLVVHLATNPNAIPRITQLEAITVTLQTLELMQACRPTIIPSRLQPVAPLHLRRGAQPI
jgi:hypothetical protein